MKYTVVINDEEFLGSGDSHTFEEAVYDIKELLRSGYYEVESIIEADLTGDEQ